MCEDDGFFDNSTTHKKKQSKKMFLNRHPRHIALLIIALFIAEWLFKSGI